MLVFRRHIIPRVCFVFTQLQSGILKNEEDRKQVANAMESQVSVLLKERNDVPDDQDIEHSEDQPERSSPEPPPSPPPSPVPTQYSAMQNLSQQNEHSPAQYAAQHHTEQQTTNLHLNKSYSADGTGGVIPPIDNTNLDNHQQTSNCSTYFIFDLSSSFKNSINSLQIA